MGYFANGTDGEIWEGRWCARCVHNQDENRACPVLAAHMIYNYELCNTKEAGKEILDMLIPIGADGFCEKCAMFHGAKGGGE